MSDCCCENPSKKQGAKRLHILVWLAFLVVGFFAGVAVERQRAAAEADAAGAALESQSAALAVQTAATQEEAALAEQMDVEALANFRRDLSNKVETLQAALLSERSDLAKAVAENQSLKKALQEADSAIDQLRKDIALAKEIQPAYEKTVAALEAAKAEVASLQGKVKAQLDSLAKKDGTIFSQKTTILELNKQLESLSGQLTEAQIKISDLIRRRGGKYIPGGRPLRFRN